MKKTLSGCRGCHCRCRGRLFGFRQCGLLTGTATTGIARRRRSTINPTPISTVTSRITGIPRRTHKGPTRTGIHRVIRVPGPAATAVIDRL
jgi:hypothetical protein